MAVVHTCPLHFERPTNFCYRQHGVETRVRVLAQGVDTPKKETKQGIIDIEEVKTLGKTPSLNAQSIIQTLISVSFHKHQILDKEFEETFREQGIAKVLANEFLQAIQQKYSVANDSDEEMSVNDSTDSVIIREEILSFFNRFHHESITFAEFIGDLIRNFGAEEVLFQLKQPDIEEKLAEKVGELAQEIIPQEYTNLYGKNLNDPKEGKKRINNFILDVLFKRIIKVKREIIEVDQKAVEQLVDFLHRQQYPLEDIAELFWDEIERMEALHQRTKEVAQEEKQAVGAIRKNTRSLIESLNILENTPLFKKEYGLDRILKFNFQPAIRQVRGEKLRKMKKCRFIDIFSLDIDELAKVVYPEEALKILQAKLAFIKQSEENLAQERREFFNFLLKEKPATEGSTEDQEVVEVGTEKSGQQDKRTEDTSQQGNEDIHTKKTNVRVTASSMSSTIPKPRETLIVKLSDQEIEEFLANELAKTADFIQCVISTALKMRHPNDPIHDDCYIPDEILECRKIEELYEWLIDPAVFKQRYPYYANFSSASIRHFASLMLRLTLFHRKHISEDDIKTDIVNQKYLTTYLKEDLKIKELGEETIKYRVRYPLNEETQNGNGEADKAKEIVVDKHIINRDPGSHFKALDSSGNEYFYYPVETKNFKRVEIEISYKDQKTNTFKRKKMQVLIYCGDNNLIHRKDWESMLVSILRGKQIKDRLRTTILVDNDEDADLLREVIYEKFTAGGVAGVEDYAEGRDKNHTRAKGSEDFAKGRVLSISCYAMVPVEETIDENDPLYHSKRKKIGEKVVRERKINFELQVLKRDKLLLSASNYTGQSHENAYKPQRTFDNVLFKYFFPIWLHGRTMAQYKKQGFAYQGEAVIEHGPLSLQTNSAQTPLPASRPAA